jgi:hypothetical protein
MLKKGTRRRRRDTRGRKSKYDFRIPRGTIKVFSLEEYPGLDLNKLSTAARNYVKYNGLENRYRFWTEDNGDVIMLRVS